VGTPDNNVVSLDSGGGFWGKERCFIQTGEGGGSIWNFLRKNAAKKGGGDKKKRIAREEEKSYQKR